MRRGCGAQLVPAILVAAVLLISLTPVQVTPSKRRLGEGLPPPLGILPGGLGSQSAPRPQDLCSQAVSPFWPQWTWGHRAS